jgi:outer membrane receptor protein involved in Fe transport
MLKRTIIGLYLIALSTGVFAQATLVIYGKLISKKTGEPVSFAGIHILETDSWTTSDEAGTFIVKPSDIPFITIEVRSLGFETYSGKFQHSLLPDSGIEIKMIPISYDMDEITVLAKNNNRLTTSSIIGNAAIEHVQPASLADVMQLLPGNISSNPNFGVVQKISIREVGEDNNSAMGASILVDGAPVSNNANLQTYSTSRQAINFSTTIGSGVDLRQISTDNIESVEVVKGIPSVTYGDMTSGAVVIKTKAGYTPWEVKLKTDAQIKQFTLGKGFNLKEKQSNINFNFDYLQAVDDLRSKYNGFNRITAEVGFSKIFNPKKSPLTYQAKLGLYGTVDDVKKDPDAMVAGEKVMSKNRGLRFNMYGKWSPKMKFLTNLDYSFSVSLEHQMSREERFRSMSGIQMISTALIEGENAGLFLPSEKFTTYEVDGKPVNVFLQITGNKFINFHHGISNKILYGFDYRLDANNGAGQLYDISNPPFVSAYNSRPRRYKDIPALRSYSVYLEDKLSVMFGKTILDVQAGIRLNNFQSTGLFKSDVGFYAEPRFNAQYSFLSKKNNQVFDKMAVRFGIGKTFKSPSLYYLYPDKAYFDLSALNYYVGNPAYDTAILYTRIFDTANSGLKPSENLKMEAGLILKIRKVNATITAFSEKLSDGFGFASNYTFLNFNKYQTGGIPPGIKPDLTKLNKVATTLPVAYQVPVNNQETQKSGVEYSFDFGKINSLYTSFALDGAWLRTKRIKSTIPYQFQPSGSTATPDLYFGVYPAGESKVSERLNTNLRMVTQIPSLRMILSTTVQMIWYDMYYFPEYDETPTYLVYSDGSTKEFTQEMRSNPAFKHFVISKNQSFYLREVMPPLLQTNFRLSKEILEKLKLSFYVNNFLNYRPEYEFKRAGSFIRRNPSVYFGAEIKVML